MKILVTGIAGFIGFHVAQKLLENNHEVVGIDNLNDYYDVTLKKARLEQLGIQYAPSSDNKRGYISKSYPTLTFFKQDLVDKEELDALFRKVRFDVVCNLAAQAGVRYSLENPSTYVDSNIVGFLNILENCRNHKIQHLVYASSSSVYGLNKEIPFKTSDKTDCPISLYAATKKSNELMAHTYSHLFDLRTTGLRFFTVYGPWGRPDMAMFLFTSAIMNERTIKIFNNGEMERDFTFIDDIVEGVVRVIEDRHTHEYDVTNPCKVYNIGNNKSVKLMDFVRTLEDKLGIQSKKEFLPMQPGDVEKTWADVNDLIRDYGYNPNTSIKYGISKFVDWYQKFYSKW